MEQDAPERTAAVDDSIPRFPEFVTGDREEPSSHESISGALTGWERVIFQVEDDPESAFSTAAAAP